MVKDVMAWQLLKLNPIWKVQRHTVRVELTRLQRPNVAHISSAYISDKSEV